VINLHAWDSARVNGNDELADRFNEYFYGPMDYAVLGWKVEA
jgi:O-antigen chain-terminating methyltransferase